MSFPLWHQQVIKKTGPVSEWNMYMRVAIFGILLFALSYGYATYQQIPNQLNKAVADTSIILIGLSMLMSSICYFWDFLDSKIIYRKHLGLVGFAFGVVHVGLSYSVLQKLLLPETWQQSTIWAPLTGLVALLIFTLMALISNRYAATQLGGKFWRLALRTGYIAMMLVFAHVVLLKLARWMTWYNGGMKTLPAMSIIVSGFIILVIIMRVLLWISLKRKQVK